MTLHRVFLTFAAAISLACCPIAMAEDGEDEAAAPAKDEATALAKYDRWVTSLGFSPANNLLVTAGGQSLQYRPGDVKIWEATSGKLVASFEGHSSNVWSVAISADGKNADHQRLRWQGDRLRCRKPEAHRDLVPTQGLVSQCGHHPRWQTLCVRGRGWNGVDLGSDSRTQTA